MGLLKVEWDGLLLKACMRDDVSIRFLPMQWIPLNQELRMHRWLTSRDAYGTCRRMASPSGLIPKTRYR